MVCEIFAVKRRNSAQRGANCHPDQIVVVGRMQQAMLACALALINEGEVAWIEDLSNPLLRTSRAPLSRFRARCYRWRSHHKPERLSFVSGFC